MGSGATRSHFVKTNIPRTISLTANKFEKSSFFLLRGDQILQLIYGPLFVLVSPEQIVVPWAFFMTFLKQIFRFDRKQFKLNKTRPHGEKTC